MMLDLRPNVEIDTNALASRVIERGPAVQGYSLKHDLHEHMDMLAQEMSGKPELVLYHAALIVHLRRGIDTDVNVRRFNEVWSKHSALLRFHLSARWLVSACDTFMDFSEDPAERAAAMAGSLLVNTVKLYETERLAVEATHSAYVDVRRRPLFDGLTAYSIGRGDMIQNLMNRVRSVSVGLTAGAVLLELLERMKQHDTVFQRFRNVHAVDASRW